MNTHHTLIRHARLAITLAITCFMLTACGGGEKDNSKDTSPPSAKDRTRAAVRQLIINVEESKFEEFTASTVYRGDDEARKWKAVNDAAVPEEKATADRYVAKIKKLLSAGKPTFVDFRSETESEGTWLVWNVKFGDSADAKPVAFACLEIDGKIVLGDID